MVDHGDPDAVWSHLWRLPDRRVSLAVARTGTGYRLLFPGLAEFDVSPGGEVVAHPVPGTPRATVRHLLRDQVIPRLMSLEGKLVLHGGAVQVAGRAVGFLGESGTGKSTLCAAFGDAGFPVSTDDGFVVDGELRAVPVHTGLRLRPDTMEHLGAAPSDPEPSGKHAVLPGSRIAFDTDPAPLGRLYLLDDEPAKRVAIDPVPPPAAFTELIRNSFQLDMTDRARATAIFDTASRVAEEIPVRRLRFPRDLSVLPAIRDAILAD